MVLGVPHPRYLPLTAEEFLEWEAYASIEPWGFDTDNSRVASLMATVANFSGNTKRIWKAEDFMPKRMPSAETVAEKVKRLFGWRRPAHEHDAQ